MVVSCSKINFLLSTCSTIYETLLDLYIWHDSRLSFTSSDIWMLKAHTFTYANIHVQCIYTIVLKLVELSVSSTHVFEVAWILSICAQMKFIIFSSLPLKSLFTLFLYLKFTAYVLHTEPQYVINLRYFLPSELLAK